ncbi:MAG: tyrosine-type recombinase/integrase [Methanosarcinaceae archaeon]
MRNNESPTFYSGELAPFMAEYMQYSHALGKKYKARPYLLASFSATVDQQKIPINGIDKDVVMNWASAGQITLLSRNARLHILKQFLIFMQQKGFSVYIPTRIKRFKNDYVPHIYTRNELVAFFHSCDNFKIDASRSNMMTVAPLLFRILYCCGLRISEALNLKIRNVNLTEGILTIKHGKFDKDRLAPIQTDLLCYCRNYYEKNHLTSTDKDYFFPKLDGTAYSSNYVRECFVKILWKAGISHGGRGVGPRMHDFRHTFAVQALKKMHDNGMDIYCSLPILSTYLGHSSIEATERYVRLTQEVFPEVVTEVSSISSYVIPEVKINETTN